MGMQGRELMPGQAGRMEWGGNRHQKIKEQLFPLGPSSLLPRIFRETSRLHTGVTSPLTHRRPSFPSRPRALKDSVPFPRASC